MAGSAAPGVVQQISGLYPRNNSGFATSILIWLLFSLAQLGLAQDNYVSAVDANQAWALVGESIYRTSDGGQTWENLNGQLTQVSALDYNTAWGVNSANQIWRTADGGVNWENVTGAYKQVSAVDFNTAWAIDVNDGIWRTNDGGQTWSTIPGALMQVSALDYNAAWGVNSANQIWLTFDGGLNWVNIAGSLKQVSAVDYNTVWGVDSGDAIVRSLDGGQSWETVNGLLKQVSVVNYNTAWGVNSGNQMFLTQDGRQNWVNIILPTGQQVASTTAQDTGNVTLSPTVTGLDVGRVEYGPGDGSVLGSFEQTSATTWVEKDAGGNVSFNFYETNRDASHVYLFDLSRGITITLDLTRNKVAYSDSTGTALDFYTINTIFRAPTAQASSVPSQFTGDLEEILSNGIEWSTDARVFRASLGDFTNSYGSRDSVSEHIQGIAYTQSKRLVINHSLVPENGNACGSILAYSTPYIYVRDNKVSWSIICLKDKHPSMLHAAGNIVAVTDSSLRFFEFDSSPGVPIRELTNLNIDSKYDAVAFAYRHQDGHYYVMAAALTDYSSLPITIWRDSSTSDSSGPPCSSLADTACKFVTFGTINDVYASSSGMGLVDQPDGTMILMAMYGLNEDYVTATEIDMDTLTARRIKEDEFIGITQVQVLMTRPACRWGCSVNVVDGQLFVLWAGRDISNDGDVDNNIIDNDDFEMAIYRMGNPTNISVSIATANVSGGGTDSNITLTIHGTTGDSAPVDITALISGDALEYGTTDTIDNFPLSQAIGDPIGVTLQTDYSYPGAAWLPESVTVTIGEKTLTVYNTTAEWLDDYDEKLRLDATANALATTATVSITTADESGAGTDSTITVTIHGTNGDSPGIVIDPYISGDALEAGTTDSTSEFPLGDDIGTPTAVSLKTEYDYPGAAWLPSVVTITIGDKTYTATNTTGEWLDDYGETLTLTLQ